MYDSGDATTIDIKGIPLVEPDELNNEETEGTTTNKSALNDDDNVMPLECDGNNCYPKFF